MRDILDELDSHYPGLVDCVVDCSQMVNSLQSWGQEFIADLLLLSSAILSTTTISQDSFFWTCRFRPGAAMGFVGQG